MNHAALGIANDQPLDLRRRGNQRLALQGEFRRRGPFPSRQFGQLLEPLYA
ncbi:hypothetical protein [Paramagnetospirillum magnetotacticum]|uniref:hypothetical protein n=1 Tax=Paramagnetospirillum magnetotacticum TaxID=188 RepID=UPI001F48C655|nr:hypothetical protein [Paramagnetospirillum magnetotacticum]